MDMWEPYFTATMAHVPDAGAKIVHDRFHVMKHVNEAVDKVRKQEHKALMAQGYETLKGKYLWLFRPQELACQASADIRRPQGQHSQGGQSVGHERELAVILELYVSWMGTQILQALDKMD